MSQVQYNNQSGRLGAAITTAPSPGTSETWPNLFAVAPDYALLTGGNYIKLILDWVPSSTGGDNPNFEVTYLTAYDPATPLAGTITRGAEDSTNWPPVAHIAGASWGNNPTTADFGVSGAAGACGVSGIQGACGISGVSGVVGACGVSGVSGVVGACGVSGTAGTNGACGVSGIAGLNGACGVSGTAGACGVQGISGISGVTGVAGSNGACGVSGTAGIAGACGVSGTAGTAGACGVSGVVGACGVSGVSGVAGACGVSGVTGVAGDKYSTTSTSSMTIAASGPLTLTVGAGLAYSIDQVIVIAHDAGDYMNALVTAYTSGTGAMSATATASTGSGTYTSWSVNLGGVAGPAGACGISGISGVVGACGVSGTAGACGVSGTTGTTGACGISGAAGTNGACGVSGTTGACGISGTAGTTGACGVSGVSGTAGACGVSGVSGVSGYFGGDSFNWTFSTSTAGTPTTGVMEFDNATPASVAHLYLYKVDYPGTDVSTWIAAMKVGSIVKVYNPSTPTNFWIGSISSAPTVTSSVYTVPVTYISASSGLPDVTAGDTVVDYTPVGACGVSGVVGACGVSGVAGACGVSGISGTAGTNGACGVSGTTGACGVSGTAGTNGACGVSGTTGACGVSGTAGAAGACGVSGTAGTAGACGISGTAGTAGACGVSGITGTAGLGFGDVVSKTSSYLVTSGDVGTIFAFNGSLLTATLPAAAPSEPWLVNFINLNATLLTISPNGLTLNGSASSITLTQNQSVFVWSNGSNYDYGEGLQGVAGACGVSGTAGACGVSGTAGTNGACGVSGTAGTTGACGVSGTAGACGVSGTAGACGISGVSGTAGACGISGTAGTTGACGVSGTAGTAGACGVSGTAGACGVSGTAGACGVSGISGVTGVGYIWNQLSQVDSEFALAPNGTASLGSWAEGSNCALSAVTTEAYIGGASMQIESIASGNMSAVTASNLYKVEVGSTYAASAYFLAASSGRSANVQINFVKADGTTSVGSFASSNVSDNTSTWTEALVWGTNGSIAPALAVYAQVIVQVILTGAANEIHYVANVGLYLTSAPPPPWSTGYPATGACGVSGTAGACGVSGTAGACGVSGVSGTAGTTGACGVSGTAGTTGACGVSGTTGACGVSGTAGSAGACGVSGTAGTAGACGVSGTAGTAGACGISGTAGTAGACGVSGVAGISPGFYFTFDTGTSAADPGAGKWRFNNATPASVTQMYVDKLDYAGTDVHPWLAGLGLGILYLFNESTPTNFWVGSVQSSTSESAGAYYQLAVTYIDGSSGLPDATANDLVAYWSPSGACGVSGTAGTAGACGVSGTAGACGVSGVTGVAGTAGACGVSGTAGACGVSGVSGVTGIGWPFTAHALTVSGNAITVSVTYAINNITNNAAGSVAITITTSGAVDGQSLLLRFYDYTGGVAQTLTWVNTENGTVSVPGTSRGSTTIPLLIAFVFNNTTTKWTCAGVG